MRIKSVSALAVIFGLSAAASADPFYVGADVSLLPFIEQQGGVFKDNGVAEPADEILYNAGCNLFRLRIFVNPDPAYSDTGGAIQNLNYDLALAQTLKADDPTAGLELDFHYSDTWADPGEQTTPAAWANDSFSQLQSDVYSYTLNTMDAFKSAGVMPTIVQVGNEINNGILWPSGELNFSGTTQQQDQSWQNLGDLLNSAISGVRASQNPGQHIPIALHIANGAQPGEPQYFFNNIQTLGGVTDFDIMGVSFYPSDDATISGLQSNLTALADTYTNKKIMVLETNYPYEDLSGYSGWPETPIGQEDELDAVKNVLLGLPNDAGEGLIYWYPEGIQVPDTNIYNGGATALFASDGEALPAIDAFSVPEPSCGLILAAAGMLFISRRSSRCRG
ncbi:MAG TPA: glycosyl hydrolase 53 family protein [Tepidisphaeraceae bacterium]|nr:glycosyl hydrolase 53 family protein [Tepidisphaeraceae bacterium]